MLQVSHSGEGRAARSVPSLLAEPNSWDRRDDVVSGSDRWLRTETRRENTNGAGDTDEICTFSLKDEFMLQYFLPSSVYLTLLQPGLDSFLKNFKHISWCTLPGNKSAVL